MDKQKVMEALTNIGTCEDDVQRRSLITDLQDDLNKDYDEFSSLSETNKKLTTDNENLRSANMKLFTRLGKDETDPNTDPNGTGVNNNKNDKLSFADLFNEKGELK